MVKRFLIVLALSWLGTAAAMGTEIAGDGVAVRYDDPYTERFARQMLESAEGSLARITVVLGFRPASPVEIVVASSEAEYRSLTRDALPEWSAAASLGGGRIVVAPVAGRVESVARVLAHELVHEVLDGAAGDTFVPRWFHEGCAQYLSGEWSVRNGLYLAWHTVRGRLLSFDEIQNIFSAQEADAGLAYDQSMLAVRWLVGEYGRDVLARIVAGLGGGSGFPEAFNTAIGLWPSEFETSYLGHVRATYGVSSMYTLVPGVWTFITILAIVIYLVKRRRNRRLLRQWEVMEAAEKIINFEDWRGHE